MIGKVSASFQVTGKMLDHWLTAGEGGSVNWGGMVQAQYSERQLLTYRLHEMRSPEFPNCGAAQI